MHDTYVTIVGNVLTKPEKRTTKNTGALVAHFKVASTARRLNRETGQWVDGNSFRVRVNCWRRLAEGVLASLITGDPVIVVGRLYTRDWKDENDNHRVGYELEAVAVGHDLSRGQSQFARNRAALSTSTVEDGQEPVLVRGEETEPAPDDRTPVRVPAPPDGYIRPAVAGDDLTGTDDPLVGAPLDGGADDDLDDGLDAAAASLDPFGPVDPVGPVGAETGKGQADDQEERSGRGRRRGRSPVPV